ncbi:hypothetical protein LEP1GSC151_4287 [Leptospira interrogans serovar Grippotyphosa str. LT2186]|uniref:Uncharacterized protein n=2 Tax=Leptospira interrogans TaxID=173 RepID=M3IAI2_LEPIR|nr:hypothetical protein LEP1GSC151_4287 [Leptospira interrogans serovar Grippotyphosa str. LT2186]EMN27836.1 hypothetical protein LEP1GSC083_3952 [Leptospira interrogans serovar Pyrogenes str. L0374]EMN72276.1 hypothetical protein LEP1GSC100_2041 [Leptospira interrogans serovar Bataviae str. UI 08561]
MFLKHLTIQNFRNHEELNLDFDSRLIFLLEIMEKVKLIF